MQTITLSLYPDTESLRIVGPITAHALAVLDHLNADHTTQVEHNALARENQRTVTCDNEDQVIEAIHSWWAA